DLTTETPFEDSVTDGMTSKIHGFETNNFDSITTETHPYSFLANNESTSLDIQTHSSIPTYQIVDNRLSQRHSQPLAFNYLATIRKIAYTEQKQNPRQKYGFGLGYAKKALDYAIRANIVDDFINYLERFIEKTNIELDKPKENNNINYLEDIEDPILTKKVQNSENDVTTQNSSTSNSNPKRERHCHKCGQTEHYAPRCPNM
ncbi:9814_t:CDS:2, partial [Gigaspora rosea]